MRHDDAAPVLGNRAAWPALVFGLLLLLALPTYVGLAIVATVDSAGLLRLLPLPYLLTLSGMALLVSLASLLFARHARQVSRRLKGSGHARPVVSWLAVVCTGVALLLTLGAMALLLYGEQERHPAALTWGRQTRVAAAREQLVIHEGGLARRPRSPGSPE